MLSVPPPQVSTDGLSVRAGYKSIQDRNGMVRAERGFVTGRHFWTITLDRCSSVQQWCARGAVAARKTHERLHPSPCVCHAVNTSTAIPGLFLVHHHHSHQQHTITNAIVISTTMTAANNIKRPLFPMGLSTLS